MQREQRHLDAEADDEAGHSNREQRRVQMRHNACSEVCHVQRTGHGIQIAGAFANACIVLDKVISSGGKTWHYWMGGWAPPVGIEFALDPLNSILAVVVTFISMMVALYSRPFVKDEDWLHVGGYYTLFGLLTVGLSGMIITGDVFNLYVYLEIMSLSGYGLIALGGRKSMLAAFRYLLFGTSIAITPTAMRIRPG